MWWSFYQLSCLQKAASIFISFPKPTLGSFLLGFLEVISGDGCVRVEAGGGGGGQEKNICICVYTCQVRYKYFYLIEEIL